jgi:hypothetical protein
MRGTVLEPERLQTMTSPSLPKCSSASSYRGAIFDKEFMEVVLEDL